MRPVALAAALAVLVGCSCEPTELEAPEAPQAVQAPVTLQPRIIHLPPHLSAFQQDMANGAAMWNQALGQEVLFVSVDTAAPENRDVVVDQRFLGRYEIAMAVYSTTICRLTISTGQLALVDGTSMAHELGHCLGLRHDNTPGSLMQPEYADNLSLHILPEHVAAVLEAE